MANLLRRLTRRQPQQAPVAEAPTPVAPAPVTPVEYTGRIATRAALSPIDYRNQIKGMLDRGVMPSLGNGFSFVIDRRGVGHEDDYISAEDYTRYFSNR